MFTAANADPNAEVGASVHVPGYPLKSIITTPKSRDFTHTGNISLLNP
jgi:hypothetical protein